MSGEEELTLNQAIEFFAYRDLRRARKAPVYVSERDWPPNTLISYWPSEVVAAVRRLWQALEEGPVTASEDGRPVPRSRWSADRLSRLAPDEQIALGPFVKEIQRSVAHVRISVAELVRFFSEPAEPTPATADVPELVAPEIVVPEPVALLTFSAEPAEPPTADAPEPAAPGNVAESGAPAKPVDARKVPLSTIVAFCRSLKGVKKNRTEMDAALKAEFGFLPRAICDDVRRKAGFAGKKGRRPKPK